MLSKLLILRADASEAIGSGHVMRLIALAQGAKRLGCDAHFVIGGEPEVCTEKVTQAGFTATATTMPLGSAEDALLLSELSAQGHARAVVVDGYGATTEYLSTLATAHRTVVIDDLADHHIPAHVVINPNYGAEALRYSVPAGTKVLAGSDYALLRAEFLEWRESPTSQQNADTRLVLTFGGSDPVDAGARVISVLGAIRPANVRIRIVVGAGFRGGDKLAAAIVGSGLEIEVVRNPVDMAGALAWGDVAVTAAGGTLWELSHLKLAVAAFSIAANQDVTAQSLAKRAMIFGGQRLSDLTDDELSGVLEEFLTDADTRGAYARRYHTLIDGRGAERAIEAILSC